jgi:hypothetical protein
MIGKMIMWEFRTRALIINWSKGDKIEIIS